MHPTSKHIGVHVPIPAHPNGRSDDARRSGNSRGNSPNDERSRINRQRQGSNPIQREFDAMAESSDGDGAKTPEGRRTPKVGNRSPQRSQGDRSSLKNEIEETARCSPPHRRRAESQAASSRSEHSRCSPPELVTVSARDAIGKTGRRTNETERRLGIGTQSGSIHLEQLLFVNHPGRFAVSNEDIGIGHHTRTKYDISINDLNYVCEAEMAAMVKRCNPKWLDTPAYTMELLRIVAKTGNRPLLEWLKKNQVDFVGISQDHTFHDEGSLLLMAAAFGHGATVAALAGLGLRCRLEELSNSSLSVLKKLLKYSADVLTVSQSARESVLIQLAARKPNFMQTLRDTTTPIHHSCSSMAKMAEKNALEIVLPLIIAGAVVTPTAMITAVSSGQASLAWTMLNDFMNKNPVEKIWLEASSAWAVMCVAISLGDIDTIEKLLIGKRPDTWKADAANVALRIAAEARVSESRDDKRYVIPQELRGYMKFASEKIARRVKIQTLLQRDFDFATRLYEQEIVMRTDYFPQPGARRVKTTKTTNTVVYRKA